MASRGLLADAGLKPPRCCCTQKVWWWAIEEKAS